MRGFRFDLNSWFESKIFLRIFSVILALIVWLLVVGGRDESVILEFDLRLEFLNPPSELTVIPSTRTVSVTLKGERRHISSMDVQSAIAEVDLRGLESGKVRLPVRVSTPARIEVIEVAPSSVEVDLVHFLEKRVSVVLREPESIPKGYTIRDPQVEPAFVQIRGRDSDVEAIDKVIVTPTLEQLEEGGQWSLPVHTGKPGAMDVTPVSVMASATYLRGNPMKAVNVRLDTTGTLPSHLMIQDIVISPTTLNVEGPEKQLSALDSLKTEPLNLRNMTGNSELTLSVVAPKSPIKLVGSNSVKVGLVLEPRQEELVYESLPVEARAAGTSIYPDWKVDPNRVNVTVRGASGALSDMTPEKLGLQVYVDVSNVVSRSLRVPVRLSYDKTVPGVETVTVEPATVKITALEKPRDASSSD